MHLLKQTLLQYTILVILGFILNSCQESDKDIIVKSIGESEYERIINLTIDEFDQSSVGFRQYANQYELINLIIPHFITKNSISDKEARNLHWYLGQIHAFNNNYEDAISEMQQSYLEGSISWNCSVRGTKAFLEKDKETLQKSLDTLGQQENIMNIEFLDKFVEHFDKSYRSAYNAN